MRQSAGPQDCSVAGPPPSPGTLSRRSNCIRARVSVSRSVPACPVSTVPGPHVPQSVLPSAGLAATKSPLWPSEEVLAGMGSISSTPNSQPGEPQLAQTPVLFPSRSPRRNSAPPLPSGPGNWAPRDSPGLSSCLYGNRGIHGCSGNQAWTTKGISPSFQRNYCCGLGGPDCPSTPPPPPLPHILPALNPDLDPRGPSRRGFQRSLKKPKPPG